MLWAQIIGRPVKNHKGLQMDTSFDARKKSFESKFAHDEQLMFKVEARTSKLVGLWAAEELGIDGDSAQTYAGEVVGANLEEPGFDDVKRKVMGDFAEKSIEHSDHVVQAKIDEMFAKAKEQVMHEVD